MKKKYIRCNKLVANQDIKHIVDVHMKGVYCTPILVQACKDFGYDGAPFQFLQFNIFLFVCTHLHISPCFMLYDKRLNIDYYYNITPNLRSIWHLIIPLGGIQVPLMTNQITLMSKLAKSCLFFNHVFFSKNL